MSLRLWDSLSESMQEVPLTIQAGENGNTDTSTTFTNSKTLAWYTCGPTTYAAMHLGHARTYVWLDMMRRVLEDQAKRNACNQPPLFVMNITDIDDKILNAAADASSQTSTSDNECLSLQISRQAEANFWKDMDRLNCQRPHVVTRVTEYVTSDIVPYIQQLVDKGMAYSTKDGVYFDVTAFEAQANNSHYGKLAGNALKNPLTATSTGTATITHKRDVRDFALWKLKKEGEDVSWPSPWGVGRPGWHIECSAMIEAVAKQFQDTHIFHVHAGGHDLKFPHHTNEIAQAEAYHATSGGTSTSSTNCPSCSNKEWIPHWVHTGHLMVNKDEKMSKSLKNFLTVDELWFDYNDGDDSNNNNIQSMLSSPADDFRWWCLMGGSYRHKEEYSRAKIRNARQQRRKLLGFLLDGEQWVTTRQQATASLSSADDKFTKRWSPEDHAFFTTVTTASREAHQALLNDMHGTQYIACLLQIAQAGSAHLRQNDNSAVEPIQLALKSCRDLMSLVGFSNVTVQAGLQNNGNSEAGSTQGQHHVVGGEKAIVEELVRFRSQVRKVALEEVKRQKKDPGSKSEYAKEILKACDQVRDNLPPIGVEVMDGKQKDDAADAANWRFCVPKEPKL